MAGSADALKVFATVWITGVQSPDEPRRNDVVHMAPDSCLFEIHSACLNLTLPPQSWRSPIPPSLPRWAGSRPLPIHAAPAYWPLLGTEAGTAVEASPVAIGAVAAVNRLEHFCSSVSAIWTTHGVFLLSVDAKPHLTLKALGWSIAILREESRRAGEIGPESRLRGTMEGYGWSSIVFSTEGLWQEFLSKYYES